MLDYKKIFLIFFLFSFDAFCQKDVFPLIMYDVQPNEKIFLELKEIGITHVHLYSLTTGVINQEKLNKINLYLDLANKYQLKVIFDLDGKKRIANNNLSEIKILLQNFKNNPAIDSWYLIDEPDNKGISVNRVKIFYDFIKKETPLIPIIVCHAWTKNWYKYIENQDVLFYDIYPVTGAIFPQAKLSDQNRFTDTALKFKNKKKIIPVLQIFNWQCMLDSNVRVFDGYNRDLLRFPSIEEFRYSCFSNLAQNVDGIAFFSYSRSIMCSNDWLYDVAKPVLKELNFFINYFKQNNFKIESLIYNKKKNIIHSEWSNGSEVVIIIINSSNSSNNFTFDSTNRDSYFNFKPYSNGIIENEEKMSNYFQLSPWEVVILKKQ